MSVGSMKMKMVPTFRGSFNSEVAVLEESRGLPRGVLPQSPPQSHPPPQLQSNKEAENYAIRMDSAAMGSISNPDQKGFSWSLFKLYIQMTIVFVIVFSVGLVATSRFMENKELGKGSMHLELSPSLVPSPEHLHLSSGVPASEDVSLDELSRSDVSRTTSRTLRFYNNNLEMETISLFEEYNPLPRILTIEDVLKDEMKHM
eukprot:TRINITY_DN24254_c0_g1_i1.p1 TRINITY_DN24254_c0_g1~~TRINITY_DN24254_c0_g1_i1.p1  ORF type:complete len:202 (+),score=29.42 TRINITY_DN24254_c0_g1_i1:173-778(+)